MSRLWWMPVVMVSQWCAMARQAGQAWLMASAASASWACTADPAPSMPGAFGEAAEDEFAGVAVMADASASRRHDSGAGGGGPAGLAGEGPGCVAEPFGGDRDARAQLGNRLGVAGWLAGRRDARRYGRQQLLPGRGRRLLQARGLDAGPGYA